MSITLGIDTGGTYTDSVLIRSSDSGKKIIRKAKSFTTHDNLLNGILSSIKGLGWEHYEEISLVCLSTTLATNSVVENKYGKTGLIWMGNSLSDGNVAASEVRKVSGKLDIKGRELEPVSPEEVEKTVREMAGHIDAFAVSGFASVRNPAHELFIKSVIRERTGMPVVCSHEVSSQLGFFDRTVTAVLNASLITNTTMLIQAVRRALSEINISAPCMIVCGDGSLMLDSAALEYPIRTVLSGPAASIAGARFLTGLSDAIVADMGGTTTDIADISKGKVKITSSGAVVGGWKTQLRAVEISTHGIGGDSWIRYDHSGSLQVTEIRVLPLCMAGQKNPGILSEWKQYHPKREHEIFYGESVDCYMLGRIPASPDYEESKLAGVLKDGPHSRFYLSEKMGRDYDKMDFSKYVSRGLLQRCSLTPTDLLHAMGRLSTGDAEVSRQAVRIMAYRAALPFEVFLQQCYDAVIRKISTACLQSSADFEKSPFNFFSPSVRFILEDCHPLLDITMRLKKTVIAIGAPVKEWFPDVCERLHTKLVVPEHAEVANAIGAAIGKVMVSKEVLIRSDQYHKGFIVHAPFQTEYFETLKEAEEFARTEAINFVRKQVFKAGGVDPDIRCERKLLESKSAETGEKKFIELRITAIAEAEPVRKNTQTPITRKEPGNSS